MRYLVKDKHHPWGGRVGVAVRREHRGAVVWVTLSFAEHREDAYLVSYPVYALDPA